MPIHELQRRDSWPPTIIHLHEPATSERSDAIDDNPFAFFLTTPEDIDDLFDGDELDAGIETPDSSRSPVREVSPSSLQRASVSSDEDAGDEDDGEEENYDFGLAMPLSLKDFTMRHNSGRKSRAEKRKEDGLLGLGITLPLTTTSTSKQHTSNSIRGRPQARIVPARTSSSSSSSSRGRGQTRSLSNRRKNSWLEPSPEIFSIEEEKENEMEKETWMSASAPATSKIEERSAPIDIPKKVVKRVHWAF